MQNALTRKQVYTKLDQRREYLESTSISYSSIKLLDFNMIVFLISLITYFALLMLPLVATEANNDIMYVIDSPILRGRNDLVAKYSTWIAFLAQAIITACGFFIITLKTVTISFTLLYLTNPRLWNKLSEVKSGLKGNGDWMSTILSWLTPDVKAYSEYGQANSDDMYDAGGIQTIAGYMKKKSVEFVVLITLASVLWSGKLLKLVGSLSQGCVAVVDFALKIDFGGKVNDMLEADRDYQFMFDKGTIEGQNKNKVALALYSQVKTAVSDNRTSDFLNSAGTRIKELLETGELGSAAQLGNEKATHVNWSNPTLTYSITFNSDVPDSDKGEGAHNNKGVWVIPMNVLFTVEGDNVSAKQQELYQKGAVYLTFNASQIYNGSDYGVGDKDTSASDETDKPTTDD